MRGGAQRANSAAKLEEAATKLIRPLSPCTMSKFRIELALAWRRGPSAQGCCCASDAPCSASCRSPRRRRGLAPARSRRRPPTRSRAGSVDVEWLRRNDAAGARQRPVALTNVTLPPLDPLISTSIDSSGDRRAGRRRRRSSRAPLVGGRVRPRIDPLAWPDRGTDRYDEVVALAQKHLLKRKNFEHTDFGQLLGQAAPSSALWTCPCTVYNVDQLCRSSEGKSLQGGREHHQGCALSHLKAFLTAYERNASSMVVMESDVILPAMWVSGKADHYDTVLKAMIEQAPEHWDMIKLDVGFYEEEWANDGIAKEDRKKPVVQLQIPELEGSKSKRDYVLYKWSGLGLAGSGHHLYSGRFVSKLPTDIKERGLGMDDACVGGMCADHYLNCYTLCIGTTLADVAFLP